MNTQEFADKLKEYIGKTLKISFAQLKDPANREEGTFTVTYYGKLMEINEWEDSKELCAYVKTKKEIVALPIERISDVDDAFEAPEPVQVNFKPFEEAKE
ncbi:MAG TPA: hypothetical protein ENI23_08105 [bacterium]|nr:hypothetical protein [bacterium]